MANGSDRVSRAPSEVRSVVDLMADPRNARKHGTRNLMTIAASLRELGAARSIVIDERGTILAGNATVEAAGQVGISKVHVVDVAGDTLVAVRRSSLSPAEKARLALLDNRTSELAEGWDVDVLRALHAEGVSLDGVWTSAELLDLLGATAVGATDPDLVPPVRETSIVPGMMFELGRHRLICGDSTDPSVVSRLLRDEVPALMVTDPPYGVEYDPSWRAAAGVSQGKRMGKVANDHRADWTAAWRLFPGAVAYVWHAALYADTVKRSLESVDLQLRSQIIWRKPRIVLSRGAYHWQHEACWYAVRSGRTAAWIGNRRQSTVWAVEAGVLRCECCGAFEALRPVAEVPSTVWDIGMTDDTGETTHGTQKPVACMLNAMRNHEAPIVFEPFAGSGSSIIAAEMLGRGCRAIELTPSYVQQAIDRWEAFTGRKAQVVQ
jgi:DNA modification methylase